MGIWSGELCRAEGALVAVVSDLGLSGGAGLGVDPLDDDCE